MNCFAIRMPKHTTAARTMADIKISFLLVFFATLFSFGQPQFTTYQQICQKTTDRNTCIQIIDASTSAKLKANANGWLQILSDQAKTIATLTVTKNGDALKNPPSRPVAKGLLDCQFIYNFTIIPDIENIEWANLNRSNYPDYNRALSLTELGVNNCEDEFIDLPTPSPIDVFNQNVKHIVDITLEVLNLNQCNKISACT